MRFGFMVCKTAALRFLLSPSKAALCTSPSNTLASLKALEYQHASHFLSLRPLSTSPASVSSSFLSIMGRPKQDALGAAIMREKRKLHVVGTPLPTHADIAELHRQRQLKASRLEAISAVRAQPLKNNGAGKTAVIDTPAVVKRGRSSGARKVHSAAVRELIPAERGLVKPEMLIEEIPSPLKRRVVVKKAKAINGAGPKVVKQKQSSPPSLVSEEDSELGVPIASLGQTKKPVGKAKVKMETGEPVFQREAAAFKTAKVKPEAVRSAALDKEGEVKPKVARKAKVKPEPEDAALGEEGKAAPPKIARKAKVKAEADDPAALGEEEKATPKRKRKDAPKRVWSNGNILSPWRPVIPVPEEIVSVSVSTDTVVEDAPAPKKKGGRKKSEVTVDKTVIVEPAAAEGGEGEVKKVKRSRKKVTYTEEDEQPDKDEEGAAAPKRKRKRKEVKVEVQEAVQTEEEKIALRKEKAQARAAAKQAANEEGWLNEDRVAEEDRQKWLMTLPRVSFTESQRTRLGYACICTELRMLKPASRSVFCSRHLTLKTLSEKGPEEAKLRALQNLSDLKKIIEWNERHGIRFFRLSSQIFPHLENPLVAPENRYDLSFAMDTLKEVGELARKYGHRLTFHPSHFNQLGAVEGKVLDGTFADLRMHADILEAMGCDQDSVLIIHGGGAYGDKDAALERVRKNVSKMPDNIRKRLVFENDEKVYHTNLLLPLSEELQIPICVDYFHHQCYGEEEFDIYDPALTARIMKVWQDRGMKPKCHISEQAPDLPVGAHSDAIDELPEKLLAIARQYDMDIMLESKDKEQSLGKLLERYFDRGVDDGRLTYALKAKTA